MTITIRTNLPEFKSKLRTLSRNMEKRVVRDATRAAGREIQKIAKQAAPVRNSATPKYVPGTRQPIPPGVLRDSISVVTKRSPRGTVTMMVIPRSGKKTRKGKGSQYLRDAYYWVWVEQGHVITRKRLKGGTRRKALERQRLSAMGKRTRPANFLKKAYQLGQSKAVDAFYAQLEKSFNKYSAL